MLAAHQDKGATVSGFGRKGLEGAPGQPTHAGLEGLRNPSRSPVQAHAGGEMSRKVDALLAAERARNAQVAGSGLSDAAADYRNVVRPVRSLTMAYLLWFLFGQLSAHRFYLGAFRSALAQLGLLAFSLFLAFGTPLDSYDSVGPVLAIVLIGWILWVLGDVFFIHRLHRELCRKPGEVAAVFA